MPAPRVPKLSKVERAEGTEGDSECVQNDMQTMTASAQRVVADYDFMGADIST